MTIRRLPKLPSQDQPALPGSDDSVPPKPTVLPSAQIITAAGVILLATTSTFGFWLWALINVLGLVTEFRSNTLVGIVRDANVWELVRVASAILGAGLLTYFSWAIALGIADD